MKLKKREQQIVSLLETHGEMSVNELSKTLGVSPSTLRKQLADMQSEGLLIRTYGGVLVANRVLDEAFDSKSTKNVAEKKRISDRALNLIPNGTSIALGSGSTCYSLAMVLGCLAKCVIYTNSMQAANYLSHYPQLEVHIASGIIRSHTGSIIGNETIEFFRALENVDFAFLGCDAINNKGEIMSDNLAVAYTERQMLLCAKKRYILCDSSKLGKHAVANVTSLDTCDGLITGSESSATAELYKTLTKVHFV